MKSNRVCARVCVREGEGGGMGMSGRGLYGVSAPHVRHIPRSRGVPRIHCFSFSGLFHLSFFPREDSYHHLQSNSSLTNIFLDHLPTQNSSLFLCHHAGPLSCHMPPKNQNGTHIRFFKATPERPHDREASSVFAGGSGMPATSTKPSPRRSPHLQPHGTGCRSPVPPFISFRGPPRISRIR